MCRLNHPLAANGTMNWPDFGVQRPAETLGGTFRVHAGTILWPRLWNQKHPLAETA